MSRPARAVRRVAVRRQHEVGVERFSAANRVVEIVDLEPERDAVPVRPRRWVADWAMVMLDSEAMQLEHETSVAKQALVFLSTVPAVTTEQLLIPTTAPRNVGDRDQRLRSHEARESKEAPTNRFPFARSPGEPNCDHLDEELSPSLGSVGPCDAKEVRACRQRRPSSKQLRRVTKRWMRSHGAIQIASSICSAAGTTPPSPIPTVPPPVVGLRSRKRGGALPPTTAAAGQ